MATHFEKITHFEKKFQSVLNLGPNQRALKIFFKVRNFSKCVVTMAQHTSCFSIY